MSAFTNALLAATPPIPGLDTTVVIPPRRVHFTLGVMSLDVDEDKSRTLEAAKSVLQELRPKILEILKGEQLRVRRIGMALYNPG